VHSDDRAGAPPKMSLPSGALGPRKFSKRRFPPGARPVTKPAGRAIAGTVIVVGQATMADFERPADCDAFAKGVEAVLSHMVAADEEHIQTDEAA
jgi:hypothetical protein